MNSLWTQLLSIFKTYLNSPALKKLIVSYVLKASGIAGGIQGWIIGLLVKYGLKKAKEAVIVQEEKVKESKNLDDYESVIKNPNSTAEEVKDAGKKFLED